MIAKLLCFLPLAAGCSVDRGLTLVCVREVERLITCCSEAITARDQIVVG